MEDIIYDIVGIGIGPFNLGLAALCYGVPELSCLFIEQHDSFNWHSGLMIEGTRLQVPFYADLVTLANPCSPFSYMAFLKAAKRMFRFAIHENYFITRKEYNQYARWVAKQLPSLRFNEKCTAIHSHVKGYKIVTNKQTYLARHIVIGAGSIPSTPSFAATIKHPFVFHSSEYLYHKEALLQQASVAIIGSGQSAAEIFYDLLRYRNKFSKGIAWFTRSECFFPMAYSKLTLELSTPDYITHFHSLNATIRSQLLSKQNALYKGINYSLINEIYDLLYVQSLEENQNAVHIHANTELKNIQVNKQNIHLSLLHTELQQQFNHSCHVLILATGYKTNIPQFLHPIKHKIHWGKNGSYNANRNYSVDDNTTIFVQNAEQYTHGFNAADLSLGPYRNAIILNTILQREYFSIEENTCFQTFGLP